MPHRFSQPEFNPWQRLLCRLNGYVPVRHRDVLTREGKLRFRYVLSGVSTCLMLMTAGGIATMNAAEMVSQSRTGSGRMAQLAMIEPAAAPLPSAIEELSPEHDVDAAERLAAAQKRLQRYKKAGETDTVASAAEEYASLMQAPAEMDGPREETVEIGKGDTLGKLLQRAGLSSTDAHNAVAVMKEYYDPRNLKLGQKVHLRYDQNDQGGGIQLASLRMDVDPVRSVSLERDPASEQGFKGSTVEKEVLKTFAARRTEIENSLYGSALKDGLPRAIVAEAIRVYSYDVDFQRDVRRGDSLEVLYEQYETEDGHQVKTGDILMARINVGGQSKVAYRYETKDGRTDFFTADGKSLRKAIMMTPIDGARISSGFGMRRHPVLGYSKMHKGMDFAAPTGTPIYAAGDGTVEKAGRFSSYGNYVRIRHTGATKTAYAHMNRFAKGVTPGVRVKQGQVIGYVGTTGRSTGPHLHFEVLENGVQVNPRNVKMQKGEPLKGTELASFKDHVRKLDDQFSDLTRSLKMASYEAPKVN